MIAGLPKLRYILLSAFLILVFVVATVTAVQQEKKCTTVQSQFSYQKMNQNQVLNQQESQSRYAYQKKIQNQNSYQKMGENGLGQNGPQEHQGSGNSGNDGGNGNGSESGNAGGNSSGSGEGNGGGNGNGK